MYLSKLSKDIKIFCKDYSNCHESITEKLVVIDVSDVIGEAIRYFKDKDTIDIISPVFELVKRLRLQMVVHFST